MVTYKRFLKATMTKGEVIQFMITTLEANGWVNVASNESIEGYIYNSKGIDGQQDIFIHFRDGANGQNGGFSTGTEGSFDIRSMTSYVPSTDGGMGVGNPAVNSLISYQRFPIINTNRLQVYPDLEVDVYYSCTANGLTMIFNTVYGTSFFIMGRVDNPLNKVTRNTGNVFYLSHNAKAVNPTQTYNIADKATTNSSTIVQLAHLPFQKSINYTNRLNLIEVGTTGAEEGIRDLLEGIYGIFESPRFLYSNKDKIIDASGNEFTIFNVGAQTGISEYIFEFTEKINHIAICTRLSGE